MKLCGHKKGFMKKIKIILAFCLSIFAVHIQAGGVKGKVFDKTNKEPLMGASVVVTELNKADYAGLDGSYSISNIPVGKYHLVVLYMGYYQDTFMLEIKSESQVVTHHFAMRSNALTLGQVDVVLGRDKESDAAAREEEKLASSVINVISAKSIEASPDITVANVVQRVSGLTIERNNNGDGQYAIVRGMDKRYNYTLVNGIKIPSPDNENRYVPLDIFPSELLSRLVVSKSLTPDMEGDAIGGVVDLKMKDAPNSTLLNLSLATGYNEMFLERKYDYYDPGTIMRNLPREEFGRIVTHQDLTYENFNYEQITPNPNIFASGVWGDRYANNKLGVVVAASYQNSYRASDREEFGISSNNRGENIPRVSQYQLREYSIQQKRLGAHNKIDYRMNEKNKISLYNAYFRLENNETRFVWLDELRAGRFPTLEYNMRSQLNIQQIYNSTLQGVHQLSKSFKLDWSLAYSVADQNLPDNSILMLAANYQDEQHRWVMDENFWRVWEQNEDKDYSVYYNFTYKPAFGNKRLELKYGGLYRMKDRFNIFDSYTFKPNPGVQEYVIYETLLQDITWRTTGGAGTPTHVLNYESYENIFANYLQFKYEIWRTQFIGGIRAEHTTQGYITTNPTFPEGEQQYWTPLPSLHIKHMPNNNMNIRTSFYRALSRPSFLEIIPYRRPDNEEIFARAGNPNLVATTSENFDIRFEYFPNPTDQILFGGFYKILNDPIEYAVIPGNVPPNLTSRSAFLPINFERAVNYGLELDYTQYFKNWGVRLNYTLTLSNIESIKRTWGEVTEDNIDQISELQQSVDNIGIGDSTFISVLQNRPLQGQSMHLANFSLLYKSKKLGLDAQLSLVYTGERIAIVALGYEDDFWQKAFTQLDFSAEKTLGRKKNFVLFVKATNLLDTPFELYIKKPHMPSQQVNPLQPDSPNTTLVRRDFYNRTYMLGLRYKLFENPG